MLMGCEDLMAHHKNITHWVHMEEMKWSGSSKCGVLAENWLTLART
jgi:hypothetical protein